MSRKLFELPKELASYESVIQSLDEQAHQDQDFIGLLEASLQEANHKAKSELDRDLYKVLEWPTSYPEYVEYLRFFVRWIPQQENIDAWKQPHTENHQEVYDRLCHFYFLIDQPVGPNKDVIVQNIDWFSDWLVDFADAWGDFLNTTDSFNDEVLASFILNSPEFQVGNSMVNGKSNNPSGWLTFNQFFARELNPGLRPIASPMDNKVVTSPADVTFRKRYNISRDSTIPEIIMKGTHKYASIEDLLEGSTYKGAFANGTFVHYFLGPYSYHRFHTPVAGIVKECYALQGGVFLEVNLKDGQFDAPDNAQGGYEFTQARGVITIDTTYPPTRPHLQ